MHTRIIARRPAPYIRLTAERQKRQLTQKRVGKLLVEFGAPRLLAQAEISAMEVGRINPTPEELAAFGRLFGVSPPERLLDVVADSELVSA
jgi:transcriptional regulator with XRE-family HTH domain